MDEVFLIAKRRGVLVPFPKSNLQRVGSRESRALKSVEAPEARTSMLNL